MSSTLLSLGITTSCWCKAEGEEKEIEGLWRRIWGTGRLGSGVWDKREEQEVENTIRFISSDLWHPILSKVPQATSLHPDQCLAMHQRSYAICSWINKETYASVTLWALSHVTTLVQPREIYTFGNAQARGAVPLWDRLRGSERTDRKAVIHTFLWDTGIPGIVSLLRRLIADCVAALGPPQDTEGPVQPPEGAAPHWRPVEISDCIEVRGEREALYRLHHLQHAQTCLDLAPFSQSTASSELPNNTLMCCVVLILWLLMRRANTCMMQDVLFE